MSEPLLHRPGAQYSFWQPAAQFERFMPGSWDGVVSSEVPLKHEGRTYGWGRVVKAVVADDGSGVTLTYEYLRDEP